MKRIRLAAILCAAAVTLNSASAGMIAGGNPGKASVAAAPESPTIALVGIGLAFAIGIAARHNGQKRMDRTD